MFTISSNKFGWCLHIVLQFILQCPKMSKCRQTEEFLDGLTLDIDELAKSIALTAK